VSGSVNRPDCPQSWGKERAVIQRPVWFGWRSLAQRHHRRHTKRSSWANVAPQITWR
jgi:hypothetical protein